MSSIQVARDRDDANPHLGRYAVSAYVKTNFRDGSEDWRLADYLTPTRLSLRDFHGRSTATFHYDYGRIKQKDQTAAVDYYPRADRNLYVCIMVQPPTPLAPYCLWCGVIPAEQLRIKGTQFEAASGDPLPAGVQVLTAYGLEYLLERRGLHRAAVVAPGQEVDEATYFKQPELVPTFNERLPRGTQRAGNRSQYPIKYEESPAPRPVTYGFGTDLDGNDPYRWSAREIIEYLLVWSDEYYDIGDNALTDEPHFVLGMAWPFSLHSFFNGIYPTLRAEGRNVWEMLKEVIDRRRGIGASLVWSITSAGWPDGTQDVELRLHSMTDTPLTVGGVTLPAVPPPFQVDLVVDEDLDIDLVEVSIDEVLAFDKIVVQGGRMRSCFSAAVHKPIPEPPEEPPDPPGLAGEANIAAIAPAWPAADQTAYEAVGDAARRRERFNRVFRMFALGDGDEAYGWFDWKTKGEEQHELCPAFDDNGQIQIEAAGPYGNLGCRLLTELPIPEASDVAAEVGEQRFFKPFALCELLDADGAGTGRWVTAHAPPDPGEDYHLEDPVAAARPDVSADVTPQDRGLEIDVHFRQGSHALAKNHFDPAEGMEPKVEAAFDYERMVVTVCAETDNRPTVIAYTGVSDHFRSRVKTIILEDAHVWVVAPGTVVGISDDGTPTIYAGEQVVRDDTGWLRAVAAMASAYYGRERAGLVLTRKGIRMDHELGTYVRSVLLNLNLQTIGAPLAEINYDFQGQTTTIRTGHAGLDLVGR